MNDSTPSELADDSQATHILTPPTQPLDLSVVIVNYNVREFLEQALLSVQKALVGISGETIVIDNASTDASVEMIRKRFSDVTVVANSQNLGFAKSSNQGICRSRGDIVVLLNPDTIVQEDTFREILQFFKMNDRAGMVGCKIMNPDGSLQLACRRSFPSPWVAFTKLSGLSRIFAGTRLFGRYNLTYLDPNACYEVEAISGSFMAVRRQTIEQVGLLDESFFMYGEDLDWCYRIGRSGWKVMYFPGTQIIHFKGESSKRAKFDSVRIFYQAMVLFTEKHFKKRYHLMFFWILWVAIWLRAGLSFIAGFLKSAAVPISDLVLLSGSLIWAVYLRFETLDKLSSFVPVMVAYSLVWMLSLKLCGAHDRNKYASSKAGFAIFLGFLINASLTFFFNQYAFSRAVVLYTSVISLIVVPGWRLLIKLLLQLGVLSFQGTLSKTLLARSTVIVGDIESARTLIQKLRSQVDSSYNVTGYICTNGEYTGEVIHGVRVLGTVDDLNVLIRDGNIQEVIFATHQLSYDRILRIISQSGDQRVGFKLMPSNLDVILGKASIDRLDDVPLLELDYRLHRKRYRLVKRIFDMSLAVVLITLTLPLLLFKKYVFSDRLISRRIQGVHRVFTVKEFSDSRSILTRRLPYLPSIVRGYMSFVGNEIRIVPAERTELMKPAVDLKPGLTGLAQVNAWKQLGTDDQEKYQIYYLKNYSPLLDIEIIFRALFGTKGNHE